MRLTRLSCDGCGRLPNFWEWVRGELSQEGYPDWRHPGIVFRGAGCPLGYDNRNKAARAFERVFGRPMPEELSYFCPACNTRAAVDLPAALAEDPGERTQLIPPPGQWFGR